MAYTTMRMSPEELRRHLSEPQPCRCCGQVPAVTRQHWNADRTLGNWVIACENPECPVRPSLSAYSWDYQEMAIARWNDEWGLWGEA